MADLFPLWAKIVRYGLGHASYWLNETDETGTTLTGDFPPISAVSRQVRVAFSRLEPTGYGDDLGMFGLHLVKDTGDGTLGIPWAGSDYTTVEGYLNTWWTAVKGDVAQNWTLQEYQWRAFGTDMPVSDKTGFLKYGPLDRRTTVASVATEAANMPNQVATTVTLRTASRKHWGRCYMPGPGSARLDTYGRYLTTYCDTIAAAWHTLLTSLDGAHLRPVVWSAKYGAALTIEHLAVDNTPDIVRRRRPKHSTYAKVYDS